MTRMARFTAEFRQARSQGRSIVTERPSWSAIQSWTASPTAASARGSQSWLLRLPRPTFRSTAQAAPSARVVKKLFDPRS